MAEVLEVDPRPYAPPRPPVGLDETSTPRVAAARPPIPAGPGQPERLDYESERKGTAKLCVVFEPGAGRRRLKVTERRTAVDCAHPRRELSDAQAPHAAKRGIVMDNLNTHTPASLYEAFAPAEARRLLERLERHDTPKQGSRLKRAETELSVLTTQGLHRRMPDLPPLRQGGAAWGGADAIRPRAPSISGSRPQRPASS